MNISGGKGRKEGRGADFFQFMGKGTLQDTPDWWISKISFLQQASRCIWGFGEVAIPRENVFMMSLSFLRGFENGNASYLLAEWMLCMYCTIPILCCSKIYKYCFSCSVR